MNALEELEYLDPLDSMVELGNKLNSMKTSGPSKFKYLTLMSENIDLLTKLSKMQEEYPNLKLTVEIEIYKNEMQSIKNKIDKNIAFLKILSNTLS